MVPFSSISRGGKPLTIKCFVDCPALPQPENGLLSTYGVALETKVTLTCNRGYTLFGEGILHCSSNGKWDAKLGDCKKGKYIKLTHLCKI